jgi:hypothetical protein
MLSGSNYTEQLFAAACSYVARGWSVIPVWGDQQPDRAKVAAVPWNTYQHRRPTATELRTWFVHRGYGGLAVVTGRVSQLVVLDFDDVDLYAQFQEQYPDLVATYTVQTRRGCHLYYRCLQSVPSRKEPGMDLQSDGRYVLAPPSMIAGHEYRGSDNALSRRLTSADIQRIQAFFEVCGTKTPPEQPAREFAPSMTVSEGFQQREREHLAPREVEALYKSLAPRVGRNQALFQTGVRARDAGWSHIAVQDCLTDVHAQQPTKGKHRGETEAQRRREAVATIESAFSRPARQPRSSGQLPNSAREALMQIGQTSTLRVIEGLYLRGIQPSQAFTYAQAVHLLRGLVGQWSIRRALTAVDPQGKPIFVPSPRTPTLANADIELPETQEKKCFVVSGAKPTRYKTSPPNCRYFTLPGVYELCEKLGVQRSGSDNLTEGDIRSPRRYRQALHREYIRRRPGQYPRSWLASRLGVSISTEKRYNLALPIQVQPRYNERHISWWNLNEIPAGFEIAGTYLMDETGKRYPARQEIATHLLAQRHTVIYRRQLTNFYCINEASPLTTRVTIPPHRGGLPARTMLQPITDTPLLSRVEMNAHPEAANALSTVKKATPSLTLTPPSLVQRQPAADTEPVIHQPPVRTKHFYRKPLPDSRMEELAQKIFRETSANSGSMSLYNARRLVDTYGAEPCEAALKRMVWLQKRNKITNPAGFLVVVARVMWRQQHNATELGSSAPRFRGEPRRTKLKSHKIGV